MFILCPFFYVPLLCFSILRKDVAGGLFRRQAPLSRMVTTVKPCNPFSNRERRLRAAEEACRPRGTADLGPGE